MLVMTVSYSFLHAFLPLTLRVTRKKDKNCSYSSCRRLFCMLPMEGEIKFLHLLMQKSLWVPSPKLKLSSLMELFV